MHTNIGAKSRTSRKAVTMSKTRLRDTARAKKRRFTYGDYWNSADNVKARLHEFVYGQVRHKIDGNR